jgi:hypothetical protein
MKAAIVMTLIMSLCALSCVKTFEVSPGIPIDTTTTKILKIDTMLIGPDTVLRVHYREK